MTKITREINHQFLDKALQNYKELNEVDLSYTIHLNRKVPANSYCEWNDNDLTEEQNSDIVGLITGHDHTQKTAEQKRKDLSHLAKRDALRFYREAKIDANGDLSELATLYTRARQYEQNNTELAAMIATNRALWEFIAGRSLNLSTNQDRAIYLFQLFEPALLVAAIEEN